MPDLSLSVEPELSQLFRGGADCQLTDGQQPFPHPWSQEQSLVFPPLQGLRQPRNWVLNVSSITYIGVASEQVQHAL